MGKFIVVVEEGDSQFLRVGKMPQDDGLVESMLAIFEYINVIWYFPFIFVLILHFEVYVSIGIDVVEDSGDFGKARHDFGHQDLRLAHFPDLEILCGCFLYLLEVNLFFSVFKPQLKGLQVDLS